MGQLWHRGGSRCFAVVNMPGYGIAGRRQKNGGNGKETACNGSNAGI